MMGDEIIKFEDFILTETTFYCRDGGDGCVEMPVNTTDNNTDCCSYLNLTGDSTVKSECRLNDNGEYKSEKV